MALERQHEGGCLPANGPVAHAAEGARESFAWKTWPPRPDGAYVLGFSIGDTPRLRS